MAALQQTLEDTKTRLIHTLKASVSPYHCIAEAQRQLFAAGFHPLALTVPWNLVPGGRYMVNAFDSTLLAFTLGTQDIAGPSGKIKLASAHTDWPCLKVKPSPELSSGRYLKLNTEVYGGPILSTWMDRPLGIAGKVCVETQNPFAPEVLFIDSKRPVFTVPSLAIHMNREVNNGTSFNAQKDMLPLAGIQGDSCTAADFFLDFLAQTTGAQKDKILDAELCLYNADEPQIIGLKEEFLSSPRIDNITSVQACLTGLMEGSCREGINGIALFDNEEVGSLTKQGANSGLLERVLEKIYLSLGFGREELLNGLMNGLMLSLDVAHALHPNYPEKCDIKNKIVMGDGVALKLASSQAYATDAAYVSIVESLCRINDIPYRKFSNRSDIRGGSTLGKISSAMLTMPTVDLGVPMLAMHSSREIMHMKDQQAMESLITAFFQ